MIPIKIQCGCGQRYAFEVEPVGGRMPAAIACPACGANGTVAANAVIAQSISAQPVVPAAPVSEVRSQPAAPALRVQPATSAARTPTPAPRTAAPLPGQVDRVQAEIQARARILWGEPPAEVTRYLMSQGIGYEEASAMVGELFQERAATLRGIGIKKIVGGFALMAVPVVAFFIFMSLGFIELKTFALTIIAGVWGLSMFIGGWFTLLSPKSQSGDVSEQ